MKFQMKHKHYECIVAWAEGKQIQGRIPGSFTWNDISRPCWDESLEYRIKPERTQWQQDLIDAVKTGKVVEYLWIHSGWEVSLLNDDPDNYQFGDATLDKYRIKPEPVVRDWMVEPNRVTYFDNQKSTKNLRLTFDGETGELKSAEVLK